MARLKLSKSTLAAQRRQLKLYERVLPSLDLKRRQLTLEHAKSARELVRLQTERDDAQRQAGTDLPMLATPAIDVRGLVGVADVRLKQDNVAGVSVPVLDEIRFSVADYSRLARPAWVDVLVERLKVASQQSLSVAIATRRVEILSRAMRRITQRVNLFEKVLIPRAQKNIARIRIFLGDLERDAVVRSKIAKAMHASAGRETGP